MCYVIRTVTVIRFALTTRRDLLLEMLALQHQLAVLARSTRRFRPSDRLLWLILRRVWPRWRDALVLDHPATVDRWHRDRFDQRWWRRSRRSGRPRIDSPCRDLIGRLAEENRLWGAPRIHGELLKLGLVVSERDVPVPAGVSKATVADLAYIPCESRRPVHTHFAGDVTVRVGR